MVILAVGLRVWKLGAIPAGMHQDEAWFAYNAMLLKDTGRNIYGERFPLSVDMWGDHVPAIHSYVIIPFITLFGANEFGFRITFVVLSLLSMALAGWLLWRWTDSRAAVVVFAALFAVSPWSLIMTRASSSVVLDTLVTLTVLTVFYEGLRWLQNQRSKETFSPAQLVLWWLAVYGLSILNYFTYFTSRIPLPAMLVLLTLFAWRQLKLEKLLILASLSLVVAYSIFPFLVMLKTPYALGRYKETTVLNSQAVQQQTFLDISRSGQAHLPVLVTRTLFNKPVENAKAFLQQYSAFFSPNVMLFESAPPQRYFVPEVGVVTIVEYVGLLLLMGTLFWTADKSNQSFRPTAFLVICFVGLSVLPTALTIDDFPNFQRGVYSVPFWQMAAAIGLSSWFASLQHLKRAELKWGQRTGLAAAGVLCLIFVVQLGYFTVHYYFHSPYANPHHRSRAGEELGHWITANAANRTMLFDHDEANFIYSYIYSQANILEYDVVSEERYFLISEWFRIGERWYVHELCRSGRLPTWLEKTRPQLLIVKRFPPNDGCRIPEQYQSVTQLAFDDGTVGYEVFEMREPMTDADWREYLEPLPTTSQTSGD